VNASCHNIPIGRKLQLCVAGKINCPVDYTRRRILEFESYPRWYSFVKNCLHNKDKGIVEVYGSVLGHELKSKIKYTLEGEYLIYNITSGVLHGCKGTVMIHHSDQSVLLFLLTVQ